MKTLAGLLAFLLGGMIFMMSCKTGGNMGAEKPVTEKERYGQLDVAETQNGALDDPASVLSGAVLELTDDNFQAILLEKEGVALVEFWAAWCGPCKMIAPVIEELAHDYNGRAVVGKVNVDYEPEITGRYGIRSIPTILILKNGEVVEKHVGTTSKQVLADKIDAYL